MNTPLKKCGKCRERTMSLVVQPYTTTLYHDGAGYEVSLADLTILRCAHCENITIPDASEVRLENELRKQARLLLPAEIKQQREALQLTQEKLARQLGVAKDTICRWETGVQIQQRSLDNFLRAYFSMPELRQFLQGESTCPPIATGNTVANSEWQE